MQPPAIWSEQTSVNTSETDFLRRWKISSFFLAMQDAASTHASLLGVGYYDLLERDMVWVLSRVKLRIYDFPLVDSPVTIQTWPKGYQQKLFFMRDFHFLAEDGHRLASASSAYVLVNPHARRVLAPTVLNGNMPDNGGLSAISEPLEKIAAVEPLEGCLTVRAGYSSVDLVGHVNNARYIDWISDCFTFDEHQAHKLAWLQVNFLNEVLPDETVQLLRAAYPTAPQNWYITGLNQNTGARAFDAALGWE